LKDLCEEFSLFVVLLSINKITSLLQKG